MTSVIEPELVEPDAHVEPKSGPVLRIVAFVVGSLLLLCGLVISLGTLAGALIGMGVANNVWRRRPQPLTRGGYWIVAGASMAVVLLAATGAVLAMAPTGSVRGVMHAADSASVAAGKQEPPELLKRLGPMYSRRYEPTAGTSRLLGIVGAVWGLGFMVGSLALLYGSLGWGAAMLLALGVTGRWPGAAMNHGALSMRMAKRTASVVLLATTCVIQGCATAGKLSQHDAIAYARNGVCGVGTADSACVVRSVERTERGYRIVIDRRPPAGQDRVAVDVRGGVFKSRHIEVTPLDTTTRRP